VKLFIHLIEELVLLLFGLDILTLSITEMFSNSLGF
jgi:hypothetical protein